MTISVAIATYNRATHLSGCLRSLRGQAFAPGDEVVVADNGSADCTADVVRQAAARCPVPLRYVYEARPGKSHALAAALRECRSDVIALIDDDVLVAPDWIAQVRTAMATTGAAVAGGRVLPLFQARVPDWLDLRHGQAFNRLGAPLGLLDYGQSPAPLGTRTALAGNMAVRRAVFEEAGGFSGSLGKLRGTLLSGEDHQLCEQVQAAGHLAVYSPAMVVRHRVPAHRLRVGYFLRWFFWSGVTHARLDAARETTATRVFGAPRYLFRQLASSVALGTAAVLVAGWTSAITHATLAAFSIGYIWTSWTSHVTSVSPVTRARSEAA